jgi:hypothetical protein
MEVLSKFQFKPEFMDKLARFSVDTWIKIFELLDPDNRKLLLSENANLEKAFANLDEKQSNLTRRKILDSTEKEKKAA